MRTTLDLNEALVRKAKRSWRERGTTLRLLPRGEAGRVSFSRSASSITAVRVLHTFKGDGLRRGVELSSTAALLDDDAVP